ncbi:MAG: sugar phosphate nucleotidyltransferase [Candidatus Anstonellales archaeon]
MYKVTKGIILAGGKGKRMWPITQPKPLIPYAGGTMLGNLVRKMRAAGIEDIVVVGSGEGGIEKEARRLGAKHIVQKKCGSGGALWSARNEVDGSFLAIAVDTYCEARDIKGVVKSGGGWVVSVKEADAGERYGKVVVKEGRVARIDEKEKGKGLVNTSIYVFDPGVFELLEKAKEQNNGEVYITDVVKGSRIYMMKGEWIDMGYPWDVLKANELELSGMKTKVKGRVSGTKVKGNVVVEEGAIVEGSFIYGNAYIGKGCVVGPNSMLNGAVCLMDGVEIGFGTIVKNSIIMQGTKAKHLSYIGDSVVGRDVNFGGGSMIANLRFDRNEVKCPSNGRFVGTGRVKFGAVVGDRVQIGVNASIMPGTLVEEGAFIGPGCVAKGKVEAAYP